MVGSQIAEIKGDPCIWTAWDDDEARFYAKIDVDFGWENDGFWTQNHGCLQNIALWNQKRTALSQLEGALA